MHIDIPCKVFTISVYGFSGIAINKDYVRKVFELSDKLWKVVKEKGVKNKGINTWIYEPGEMVFAGVELEEVPGESTGLELKQINLPKYARYKHIGPYSLIKQTGQNMQAELQRKGLQTILPYIELYGHWTPDESKLETDLIIALA